MKYFLTVLSILSLLAGSGMWSFYLLVYADRPIRFSYLLITLGPTIVGAAALVALSWRSSWAAPLRLDGPARPTRVVLAALVGTACSYVPLAFLFWFLATMAVAQWADPGNSENAVFRTTERALFAALMGLWMPLGWSALPGSIMAWAWLHRSSGTSKRRALPKAGVRSSADVR